MTTPTIAEIVQETALKLPDAGQNPHPVAVEIITRAIERATAELMVEHANQVAEMCEYEAQLREQNAALVAQLEASNVNFSEQLKSLSKL